MTEHRRKAIPVEVGRSVAEWVGATPDTAIPRRVRLRVWERADGRCQAGCGRELRPPADQWQCDHEVALVNGGENREKNLRVACSFCHRAKTTDDVAEKKTVARKKRKHLGLKPRSSLSNPRYRKTMSGQVVDRKTGEPVERKAR